MHRSWAQCSRGRRVVGYSNVLGDRTVRSSMVPFVYPKFGESRAIGGTARHRSFASGWRTTESDRTLRPIAAVRCDTTSPRRMATVCRRRKGEVPVTQRATQRTRRLRRGVFDGHHVGTAQAPVCLSGLSAVAFGFDPDSAWAVVVCARQHRACRITGCHRNAPLNCRGLLCRAFASILPDRRWSVPRYRRLWVARVSCRALSHHQGTASIFLRRRSADVA
jgi:hypothetical protein